MQIKKIIKKLKNLKLYKKIFVLLEILLFVFPTTIVNANVIDVGDTTYIERGELGFYTIEYWNEAKGRYMYITYSRTYYTDKNGEKRIAYCMDPDLDGVGWLPGEEEGYDVNIDHLLEDERLWRVYKNGYPYVTPEQLGVETEDDAYLATKQAAYCIIKGRTLDNIYGHFIPGQEEINGQELEDIQRRGVKVVDAIYRLVDIGYNGGETVPQSDIQKVGSFIQDKNQEYYSQTYKISSSDNSAVYTINSLEKAPMGTYVADENGNRKSTFSSGEKFKIMVKKSYINNNYTINLNYTKTSTSYPVYYGRSQKEGAQNYYVIAEKNFSESGKLKVAIDGYKSNLKIIKVDEETRVPVEGAKFYLQYENGNSIGEYVSDKNGEIRVNEILQGTVIITELEANDNYELDTTPQKINLNYNETQTITLTNFHKKGELQILKVDKEDHNIVLENVEFSLLDYDGGEVARIFTDENGKAVVNNINTGKYILKEWATKDNYKVGEDIEVEILWNEATQITVENDRKKGQIEIFKEDKENPDIKLQNVEFNIMDKDKNIIETLITDENGKAITNTLDLGKYYVQEIKTNDAYVLDDNIIEIDINDEGIVELKLQNEKKKGQIKIEKTSSKDSKITKEEARSKLKGAKFAIYDEKNNFVEEIQTNEQGIAISSKLDLGKYKVKEIEAPQWYILDNKIYEIEIKEDREIVNIEAENDPENPEVKITKTAPEMSKENSEIKYEFTIENTGNIQLSNFTWYDYLPYENSKITKISTGTYNQNLSYSIYYKTNKKVEYEILEYNLSTDENHYIDLSNIHLEDDELITQIKVDFGNVNIGFKNIETPYIYVKTSEKLDSDIELKNETILEGNNKNYKVCDEAETITKIVKLKEIAKVKKLPRTGF